MIQPELWMLTPFVLFLSLRIPLMNAADEKTQRKLNDQNENYIITHYGVEYYTPVTDIEAAPVVHNSGYYTAEVIPVDVNTGDELKSVKNLFVPMHTGYSIGPNNNKNPAYANPVHLTEQDQIVEPKSSSTVVDEQLPAKKDDTKSKIPKKFKNKYATPTQKKTSPNHITDVTPEQFQESSTVLKKNRKRNAVTSATSDDFLRLFYDNLRSLIQRQYLGYDY